MSTVPTVNDLYREARKLANDGQPVFPCLSKGEKAKRPLIKGGLHSASTDPAQIKSWWSKFRDHLPAIGIPTGIVWDVLDVDTKNAVDGRKHLTSLQELGLLNGCQFVVRTPSGGWHLYFKSVPNMGLTNKANAGLGLDVRSSGGYVLAPPSFLETPDYTGGYEHLGDTEYANEDPLLWDLIVASLAPVNTDTKKPMELPPTERRSLGGLRNHIAKLQPGERNNGFFWAVCRCIENGIDPNELVEVATMIGLAEDEVLLTVNSALRRAGLRASDLDSESEAMFAR